MQWHTPIGYKVINGKIEVYEEHRKLVEQIFRDYDSGISTWQIAKSLKGLGVKNANGRVAWTHASIGRILENHNYLGTEYYPQIIEKELFDRVQKRREQVRIEGMWQRLQPYSGTQQKEKERDSEVEVQELCVSEQSNLQRRLYLGQAGGRGVHPCHQQPDTEPGVDGEVPRKAAANQPCIPET